MLKKIVAIIGSVGLMFGLSGCMQGDTVVKVNKDGSGTIEKTVLMRKDMMLMLKNMSMLTDQNNSSTGNEFRFFDENKLKNQASENGEGVVYLSGKEVDTGNFEGYTAVYSFADVNKLSINQDLNPEAPNGNQPSKPKEYVTFQFDKGNPSNLIIKLAKTNNKKVKPEAKPQPVVSKEQTEAMLKKAKKMFEGMRMSMSVEVNGRIVQTNATYQEGSHITLMDIDFGKFLDNPEVMTTFSQQENMSMEDKKEILKNIDGVKVDMNDEVVVQFK